jgi:hypothetical protein
VISFDDRILWKEPIHFAPVQAAYKRDGRAVYPQTDAPIADAYAVILAMAA